MNASARSCLKEPQRTYHEHAHRKSDEPHRSSWRSCLFVSSDERFRTARPPSGSGVAGRSAGSDGRTMLLVGGGPPLSMLAVSSFIAGRLRSGSDRDEVNATPPEADPAAGLCCDAPADIAAPSARGDGDVNSQVPIVGEQVGDRGVEHQAVAVQDSGRHPVVDGARRGLPGEPAAVAVELQAVGKVLGLLAGSNKQHDGKELLVALVLLLLLQDEHEVVTETRLHHHPVHGARESDVCRQEDNVLPLQTEEDRRH